VAFLDDLCSHHFSQQSYLLPKRSTMHRISGLSSETTPGEGDLKAPNRRLKEDLERAIWLQRFLRTQLGRHP
jgi:hypothetical protein